MAHIVEHLPVAALEKLYRAARDATEARHIQAIWLLAQGRAVLDVAGVLAFAPRWVEELAARYNAHGPDALGDQRRRNGRAASVLTPALLAALAERLRTPPEDGGRWTGPKVAPWMARHLGVERVHPQRGWEALKRVQWSPQMPRPRHPRSATSGERLRSTPEQQAEFKGGSTRQLRRPGLRTPSSPSRCGPRYEHRLGLKPIRRRVWAPIGERPTALGHHRYEWLHVTAFVQPTSGEAVWFLSTGLSKPLFERLLAAFARQTGAGRERHIILVLDNAGWHGPKGLAVPDGITLAFLPPYSPELQPAERLWPLVDEPVANRHFATLADLDAVVAERCRRLDAATIRPHTSFHWWPKPVQPN